MEKVNETPIKEQEQPQQANEATAEPTAAAENMAATTEDMTDTKADGPTPNEPGQNDDAAAQNENPVVDEVTRLTAEVAQLEAERLELKDKFLRLYAEFDNYKRRTSKERIDLLKTASSDVLRELLPVLDDFDRASQAAGEEGLPEGIKLIHEKLANTLSRKGLKPMESTGQAFDAELHEAITEIPAPTEEMKGKVIDTVEKGYTLNDSIIRFAKVVVGK